MSDIRRQFDAVEETARTRADMLVRALVVEADRRLREKSPVDTGLFRGNWNISVGQEDVTVRDVYDGPGPNRKKRKRDEAPPPPPPAKAREIPSFIRSGDVVFLTNALPYAEKLEYGHSTQAPEGMVRVTAVELGPLSEQVVSKIEATIKGPLSTWLNSDDPLAKIARENDPNGPS